MAKKATRRALASVPVAFREQMLLNGYANLYGTHGITSSMIIYHTTVSVNYQNKGELTALRFSGARSASVWKRLLEAYNCSTLWPLASSQALFQAIRQLPADSIVEPKMSGD